MCEAHGDALSGFDAAAASGLYDRGRPAYPAELADRILDEAPKDRAFSVVELGSGTGLFTRLLLSRPGAAKLATLTAVDPSAGMRAAFGTSITSLAAAVGPEISCLDGRFDQIPVPDATADLVVAAQAFHWIGEDRDDAEAAMREVARVLKPGSGVLCLLWNVEDAAYAKWYLDVRAAYEEYEKGQPQYYRMQWKVIYDTLAFRSLFKGPHEATTRWRRPTSRSGMLDRIASKSFVSKQSEKVQQEILSRVGAAIDNAKDVDWIDEANAQFYCPYRSDLYLIPLKNRLV